MDDLQESYPQLAETAAGLESYLDKERRQYIHFVDGGITDNLGLRALYDVIGLFGGGRSVFKLLGRINASPSSYNFGGCLDG